MAIRVPVLQDSTRTQAPRIRTPQFAAPGRGTSGAQVARAEADLGKQIARFGKALEKRLVERQNARNQQRVAAAETDFRIRIQNTLLDDDPGEGGAPKGLLSRRLGQAEGVTVEFDQSYGKMREEFLLNSDNDQQRAELAGRMDRFFASTRVGVLRHEAKQGRDNFAFSLDANLKRRVQDSAAISVPEDLADYISETQDIQSEGRKNQGWSGAQIEAANADIANQIAETSIKAMSDRNPRLAQDALSDIRPLLTPDVAASLDNTIEQKVFSEDAATIWGAMESNLRTNTNGSVNIKAMREQFDLLTRGEPQKRKDQLWNYMKSNMSEQNAIARQEKTELVNANDTNENDLYTRALDKELTIGEADRLRANGSISIPFYNKLAGRIRARNDDPDIDLAEKSQRYMELLDAFNDLKGGKVDKKGKIVRPASGNDIETIQAFRDKLRSSAGHLTERQERTFLDFTARNFASDQESKMSILKDFALSLAGIVVSPAASVVSMTSIMGDMLLPSTSVKRANEMAQDEIEKQEDIANPNFGSLRARFKAGESITQTNAAGVTAKIIGFRDGKPVWEFVR